MPKRAYIAIGSNIEDRRAHLESGISAVAAFPNTCITAISSIYETPPIGPVEQADFLNGVFAVDTSLSPDALLISMLQTEKDHLRQRNLRWGPRTLDLDLLLYGEHIVESASLTLPHPHMNDRCFVLVPLCEIAPNQHHPLTGLALATHLAALDCSGETKAVGRLTLAPTDHV
ncbi:MAG TPA: 2-amino-4-hydroxy-6-hydroxymethyldihydropteridine diphosphokinase [Candidatus Latescibacteria bacterium]|nr:2-amino-4-hydroxy-6-hydroxymethyldihydropteridine diphosphokinase [Candidatus Handelsmanbacteria bacterium]HIL07452.1 2-amino-4-hydroxy-6-hydroxymethyldihydropteridine diphosphokinase [Candidatus Latescibacterota bacterium]